MSFLDDLKKSLGGAVDTAAKKTGEVTGTAKLKLELRNQNTRLSKAYELIGRAYYASIKGGELDEAAVTAAAAEADAAKAEMAALRVQLAKLHGAVICPACSAQISDKSIFCPLCGVKQPEIVSEEETPAEDIPNEEAAEAAESFDEVSEDVTDGADAAVETVDDEALN